MRSKLIQIRIDNISNSTGLKMKNIITKKAISKIRKWL